MRTIHVFSNICVLLVLSLQYSATSMWNEFAKARPTEKIARQIHLRT